MGMNSSIYVIMTHAIYLFIYDNKTLSKNNLKYPAEKERCQFMSV